MQSFSFYVNRFNATISLLIFLFIFITITGLCFYGLSYSESLTNFLTNNFLERIFFILGLTLLSAFLFRKINRKKITASYSKGEWTIKDNKRILLSNQKNIWLGATYFTIQIVSKNGYLVFEREVIIELFQAIFFSLFPINIKTKQPLKDFKKYADNLYFKDDNPEINILKIHKARFHHIPNLFLLILGTFTLSLFILIGLNQWLVYLGLQLGINPLGYFLFIIIFIIGSHLVNVLYINEFIVFQSDEISFHHQKRTILKQMHDLTAIDYETVAKWDKGYKNIKKVIFYFPDFSFSFIKRINLDQRNKNLVSNKVNYTNFEVFLKDKLNLKRQNKHGKTSFVPK